MLERRDREEVLGETRQVFRWRTARHVPNVFTTGGLPPPPIMRGGRRGKGTSALARRRTRISNGIVFRFFRKSRRRNNIHAHSSSAFASGSFAIRTRSNRSSSRPGGRVMRIKYKFEFVAIVSGLFMLLTMYELPVASYFKVNTPNYVSGRKLARVVCFFSLKKLSILDAKKRV